VYTQNTPVHVSLWRREFWYLAIANLLLTSSVYMLIPVLSDRLLTRYTTWQSAVAVAVYGVGLFLPGGFCSYLVQRYRRNRVCIWSIIALAASFAVLYYGAGRMPYAALLAVRLLNGMGFGLCQMVLMSTLIIDTCESFQRTEANHSATWFGRFALSLGPLATLLICQTGNGASVALVSIACQIAAMLLVLSIRFPFRAPEETVCKFSLDRFFLPEGKWLFVNLALFTTALGLFLTIPQKSMFYCMLMVGFLAALLAQKFVFINAELKSEVVSGLLLMGCALLMQLSSREVAVDYLSPVFAGAGTGIVGARFLLFFIKLSWHCQRGTSQSTYFLGWETGLTLGLSIGCACFRSSTHTLVFVSLTFIILAWAMYQLFTHTWYLKNKNR